MTQDAINATNGTAPASGGGQEPVVEQGPEWLAELFVNPPGWLSAAVIGGILLVLLVIAFALASIADDLDAAEKRALGLEMAQVLLIVGLMGGATKLLVEGADLPYWIDVLGGSTLGFASAQAVIQGLPHVVDVDAVAMAAGSND